MEIATQEQIRKKRTTIVSIATGVVVLGLYAATIIYRPKNADVIQNAPPPISAPVPGGSAMSYRDGTYSATGIYTIPVGEEHIDVTLSLSQGVVINADVAFDPKVSTSAFYQAQFSAGYKEFVVGKKIDEIQITKVSGSSLTSKGFNAALDRIKAEAKL